jgi:hypothetical protein
MPYTVKELVREYGPFKRIDRKREAALLKAGKYRHIFTLMSVDVPYADLKKEDRPSKMELKERGETKDEYTASVPYASVGHHLVNVDEIFESKKLMPEDLSMEGFDQLWFEDDGLPVS